MTNAKRALITGASSGIGRELAKLYAQDGYGVVLVARSEDKLKALADELSSAYRVDAQVIAQDLSAPDAADVILAETESRGLTIDHLVNNAGFGSNGPFVEQDRARELRMIQVNCTALTALTHAFVPGMVARGGGAVLNIASTAGFQPGPFMAVYYATKSYVIHFSEALAVELEGSGVTVTAHCPGATATEFAGEAGNDGSRLFQQGSVATAEDVARHAYEAAEAGRVVAIHGAMNKVMATSIRFGPRSLVRAITGWVNGKA